MIEINVKEQNQEYGFWNPFEAVFDKAKTIIREKKHRDYVINAFKKIFGRNPTDEEIDQVFEAYEKNLDTYGDKLSQYHFVTDIQRAIKKIVPDFKVDGKFYYGTVIGIMKYQSARGIPVTGVLDKTTLKDMAAILTDTSVSDLTSSSTIDKIMNPKTIMIVGGIGIFALVAFILYKQMRD